MAADLQQFLASNGVVLAVTAGCMVLIAILIKFLLGGDKSDRRKNEDTDNHITEAKANGNGHTTDKANGNGVRNGHKPAVKQRKAQNGSVSVTSPCVVASFKGHGDTVSDFDLSPNGCLLASVSPDRSLFLWTFDDLLQSDKLFSRVNVELDEAMQISWSPDSKAFVTSLRSENAIQVWKIAKKQPETNPPKMTATPFNKYETNSPNKTFVGCLVSSTGKFIATFADDSTLKIWSLKGQLYHSLDTRQGVGSGIAISPAGHLVASYGFTSEVRVFDVLFDKQGNFVDMKRAFELGGHSTSIVATAFDRESKRMVSVSKDGVWRLWNIDVEYRLNQDPKLICHGVLPSDAISRGSPIPISAAISVQSVILGTNHSLYTFDGSADANGHLERVDDLGGAAQTGVISRLRLDATGEYALVAVGRAVVVCSLFGELKLRLKHATQAVKSAKGALAERLNQQIAALTTKLAASDQ